jgi:hypothetical protein
MDNIIGFLTGAGIGLLVSIPLGLLATYFIVMWKIQRVLSNAGTEATGLAAKLVKRAALEYAKKRVLAPPSPREDAVTKAQIDAYARPQ